MGAYGAEISEEAADFLADAAGGDARAALNAVELGVLTTPKGADGKIHLTLEVASECIRSGRSAMIRTAITIMIRYRVH